MKVRITATVGDIQVFDETIVSDSFDVGMHLIDPTVKILAQRLQTEIRKQRPEKERL